MSAEDYRKKQLRQALRRKKRLKVPRAAKGSSTREEIWEQVKDLLGVPTGAHWVCREGGLNGPDDRRIPPWCEGVGGFRAEHGIWHPAESLGEGRVLWKRLIYPATKPSPLEQIAEIAHEEE